MKVERETTGSVRVCIEASQHEFAELIDALNAGRKTNHQKQLIQILANGIMTAAGLDPQDGSPPKTVERG